jgi:hypothetical protein
MKFKKAFKVLAALSLITAYFLYADFSSARNSRTRTGSRPSLSTRTGFSRSAGGRFGSAPRGAIITRGASIGTPPSSSPKEKDEPAPSSSGGVQIIDDGSEPIITTPTQPKQKTQPAPPKFIQAAPPKTRKMQFRPELAGSYDTEEEGVSQFKCKAQVEEILLRYCRGEKISSGAMARNQGNLENPDCKNMSVIQLIQKSGIGNVSPDGTITINQSVSYQNPQDPNGGVANLYVDPECEENIFLVANQIRDDGKIFDIASTQCQTFLARAEDAQKCYQIVSDWSGGGESIFKPGKNITVKTRLENVCNHPERHAYADTTIAQAMYKAGDKGSADFLGKVSNAIRLKGTMKNLNWKDRARVILATVAQEAMRFCPPSKHSYLKSMTDMQQVAASVDEKNQISDAIEGIVTYPIEWGTDKLWDAAGRGAKGLIDKITGRDQQDGDDLSGYTDLDLQQIYSETSEKTYETDDGEVGNNEDDEETDDEDEDNNEDDEDEPDEPEEQQVTEATEPGGGTGDGDGEYETDDELATEEPDNEQEPEEQVTDETEVESPGHICECRGIMRLNSSYYNVFNYNSNLNSQDLCKQYCCNTGQYLDLNKMYVVASSKVTSQKVIVYTDPQQPSGKGADYMEHNDFSNLTTYPRFYNLRIRYYKTTNINKFPSSKTIISNQYSEKENEKVEKYIKSKTIKEGKVEKKGNELKKTGDLTLICDPIQLCHCSMRFDVKKSGKSKEKVTLHMFKNTNDDIENEYETQQCREFCCKESNYNIALQSLINEEYEICENSRYGSFDPIISYKKGMLINALASFSKDLYEVLKNYHHHEKGVKWRKSLDAAKQDMESCYNSSYSGSTGKSYGQVIPKIIAKECDFNDDGYSKTTKKSTESDPSLVCCCGIKGAPGCHWMNKCNGVGHTVDPSGESCE